MFEILSKKNLAQDCKEYLVSAQWVAAKAEPGQFVVLRVDENGERIPLTIADFDREGGTITLVVQEVGTTTKKLGLLGEGDKIRDLAGPLGHPSVIEKLDGIVVVIGGGVGTAAVYPVARGFARMGNFVVGIIGARNKNLLVWEEEMRNVVSELLITTDDGSYGMRGFVTDALKNIHAKGYKIAQVFSVGPVPMMEATCRTTIELGKLPTVVSLNPIMLDGTGMCGVCRVSVDGQTRFVCVDGPDFDGHLVDFTGLKKRQAMYRKYERESLERFLQKCDRCK